MTGRCVSCVRRPLPSVSCVTQYSFVRSFTCAPRKFTRATAIAMSSGSLITSRSEGQKEQVTSYEEVEVAVLGDPAHTARLTALLTTAEPTRSAALGIERM